MLPEVHLVYKNCDTSCEKYYEIEESRNRNMILPLIIEEKSPDRLFYCAKCALIIFGAVSICLIVTYMIYTYN